METQDLTIRFPSELLAKAQKVQESNESFNDLVVKALESEVTRRTVWAAHQRIIARSEIIKAKAGIQASSTDMIRSLREGEGIRD
ncbi:MAG: YlcI/YnfO family protein [Trichormus sp.]